MLDGELRQEVGKGEKGVTSGLQEGGRKGGTSHAMESCVYPLT